MFDYFFALGIGEHFFNFRHEVKADLESQLTDLDSIVVQKELSLSSAQ